MGRSWRRLVRRRRRVLHEGYDGRPRRRLLVSPQSVGQLALMRTGAELVHRRRWAATANPELGGCGIVCSPAGSSGDSSATRPAGYSAVMCDVTGTLSKGAGSFKIDHPLDPANKYLYHSFVESPDMKNIYDGVALTDSRGMAIVTLPDWFEALNRDFRYQLTAICAPQPNLHIAREVDSNQFVIAGGVPGAKVSWQVTGIRKDAYANAHRIPVEQDKPEKERGHYLHPELFGHATEDSVLAADRPELFKQMQKQRAAQAHK